jgi:hypothetical protein
MTDQSLERADLSLLIGPTWITSGLTSGRHGALVRIEVPKAAISMSVAFIPHVSEGIVITLWSITDHSSAAPVPDNEHPAL